MHEVMNEPVHPWMHVCVGKRACVFARMEMYMYVYMYTYIYMYMYMYNVQCIMYRHIVYAIVFVFVLECTCM